MRESNIELLRIYSMGAYIKLYGSSIKLCGSYITQKTGMILSAIGILGAFLGDILVDVLAMRDPAYMKQIFYFTKNDYGFQYYDSALLPLYAIFMVALIFIVGMVVDYIRLTFIEKPIMKLMTLYIDSSQSWMEKKVSF